MSKELEAYFKIDNTLCLNSQNIRFGMDVDEHIDCQNVDELTNCLETIREALNELEAIKNVNPSEALECLEEMWELSCDSRKPEYTLYDTIKQALLKQQELPEPFKTGIDLGVIKSKKYLKWEDLEFKDYEQEIFVLLNDNKYSLKYTLLPDDDFYMVWIYKKNKCIFSLDGKYLENKQFFNDLHLERVE